MLFYIYDESGSPIGVRYHGLLSAEGQFDTYFYEKNLQGDVVAIYREDGSKIATYVYDAWGNFTKSKTTGITYTAADNYVYENNPFTYRSYYYDSALGMYYLKTRYYDPSIGRFISADGYINANGDIVGFNMFAYCSNNPIMYTDPTGQWKLFEDVTTVLNDISDILWENLTIKVGVGPGFGLSFNICKQVGLELTEKMDFVTVKFDKEKILEFSQEGRSAIAFNVAGFTIGPQSDTVEYFNGYEGREAPGPYWVDFDLSLGVSKKQYFFYGYQYEVSFSFSGAAIDLFEYFNTKFN